VLTAKIIIIFSFSFLTVRNTHGAVTKTILSTRKKCTGRISYAQKEFLPCAQEEMKPQVSIELETLRLQVRCVTAILTSCAAAKINAMFCDKSCILYF